ncbi:MAG: hypothetical protein ACI8U3_001845 [Brevundimonas sp.]|uniref:hypothetical protein n=1 Tax=Brevundimonas sp. TaxID=1871086 RepID=UPI0039E57798
MEKEASERRLSGWWPIIAFAVGVPVAVLVGQLATEGTALIAGVMAAALIFCLAAFWDFRAKPWFSPLVALWIIAHLTVLIFFVFPMKLEGSKLLLALIFPEYLTFAALVWLTSKKWVGRVQS